MWRWQVVRRIGFSMTAAAGLMVLHGCNGGGGADVPPEEAESHPAHEEALPANDPKAGPEPPAADGQPPQ